MAHSERLFAVEAIVNEPSHTVAGLRESSARLDRMDQRFDRLEDRLAKQFGWIIGMQVTVLLAFVGSVVTLVVMRG
jgi:tetrahydromethanopterin S-methyltransferase subunit G